jgi:hypothetical protein
MRILSVVGVHAFDELLVHVATGHTQLRILLQKLFLPLVLVCQLILRSRRCGRCRGCLRLLLLEHLVSQSKTCSSLNSSTA